MNNLVIDKTVWNEDIGSDGINRSNLRKLRDYMPNKVSDEEFDMEIFWDVNVYLGLCGSVGCLLGHSAKLFTEWVYEYCIEYDLIGKELPLTLYSELSLQLYGIYARSNVWSFLFSMNWTEYDNSRKGTIARIEFVIKNVDYDYDKDGYDRWLRMYKVDE